MDISKDDKGEKRLKSDNEIIRKLIASLSRSTRSTGKGYQIWIMILLCDNLGNILPNALNNIKLSLGSIKKDI